MIGTAVSATFSGWRNDCGAPITAIARVGSDLAFTTGDGQIRLVTAAGDVRAVAAHGGAILCAASHPDGKHLLTGGDDGRLLAVAPNGDITELGQFGSKWVDHVVASPASGVIVASAGRRAYVWPRGSSEAAHHFVYPTTVGGLALDAKGRRLAASHYNGATLTYVLTAKGGRHELIWGGSLLACTLAPDAGFLVTAAQETGLHCWKLPEGIDMAMRGYKAKTRAFSWNRRGRWLATSGDTAVICWPFASKTGPMNQRANVVGKRDAFVTSVAFHPASDVIAAGYSDGAVMLIRMEDDSVLEIDTPEDGEPVTAVTWSADGSLLGWGSEGGRAGLIATASLASRKMVPA